MHIEQQDQNTYIIKDGNNIVLSASSIDELYKKALELMHVFTYPATQPVLTREESKQALDILTSHISLDLP